jgi:hypothetical protein
MLHCDVLPGTPVFFFGGGRNFIDLAEEATKTLPNIQETTISHLRF